LQQQKLACIAAGFGGLYTFVMMSLACKNLNTNVEEICSSRSSNCCWVWRFAHAGDDELGMKNLNVNVLFFKRFAAAKA
jgi:hypothetical protein